MRKMLGCLLVALCGLIAIPANAQFRIGVKGGLNVSSVHIDKELLDASNVTGFHIGPMIELMSGTGLGLDAAILYSQKGLEAKGVGSVKHSMKTDYLDVPVNLKWKFGLPIVKAYLAAGPYVGFRVGGDKFWEMPGSVVDQVKAKTFSAGVNLGVGVELIRFLQVGFTYGLGLTDNYSVDKGSLSEGAGKSRGWSLTAAILF